MAKDYSEIEDVDELTDEEIDEAYGRMFAEEDEHVNDDIPAILPSQFTEFAFRVPTEDGLLVPFSFAQRRHLVQMYNTSARRLLFVCGRQTEKSTTIGNIMLCYSCMIPSFRTLYVSSSAGQAKTFSSDRIKEPIETSDVLKMFAANMLSQNILEKQFVNRAKITIRYAFLNADRTRGIPAWALFLDELQDILADNIPVIEQCTSHAPETRKRFVYAGTPKSLDNTIEVYRSRHSTQGEWVVPCDRCGSSSGTGRHWNVLGEKNIGKKGLVCERCHQLINPVHPDAKWAFMVKYDERRTPWESYRIPQLMVPWQPWSEILYDYNNYDRARFYNEVLGISYDSGLRPLTLDQVRDCCRQDLTMHSDYVERFRHSVSGNYVYAGLDWGCHDDQTRILTEDGWKYFPELNDDDRVAQFNPDTREMTFVRPLAKTDKPWKGDLLHFHTKGRMDLMVTPDHRMLVKGLNAPWRIEEARQTAARGGNVNFVGAVSWKGVERPTFTLPGLSKSSGYSGSQDHVMQMDGWLELLGYLISEGGTCLVDDKPYCLKMSQRVAVNPVTAAKIQAVLDACQVPHSAFPNPNTTDINWTINRKQYWYWFSKNVGKYGYVKRIPREFMELSARQLRILFDALMAGDGSWDPRKNCTGGTYTSTSKGLCEDVQELALKLGYRASVKFAKPAIGNKREQWITRISAGRELVFNTPSRKVERVPYDGRVYCVTVPDGCIVTERGGCVSYQGNSGEHSYTVLTLGTYVETRFRIFFVHRFIGEDTEPDIQMKKIVELIQYFGAKIIGADYGGGFAMNDTLIRKFGTQRVQKWQYVGRNKKKVEWDPKLRRWKLHRTEVMSDIFNAIRRKQLEFPRWEEFENPYAEDMLNIYSEYNEAQKMIQYSHSIDKPDDTFHSILYCFLASMLVTPRPDIIAPTREDANSGPIMGGYPGTVDQG